MLEAYKQLWKRWSDFSGRSSVSDFWWVVLANLLIGITLLSAGFGLAAMFSSLNLIEDALITILYTPYLIYSLSALIPMLSLLIRRLHDSGLPGVTLLLIFVPFGTIIILAFTLRSSVATENQWGSPNQKASPQTSTTPTQSPKTNTNRISTAVWVITAAIAIISIIAVILSSNTNPKTTHQSIPRKTTTTPAPRPTTASTYTPDPQYDITPEQWANNFKNALAAWNSELLIVVTDYADDNVTAQEFHNTWVKHRPQILIRQQQIANVIDQTPDSLATPAQRQDLNRLKVLYIEKIACLDALDKAIQEGSPIDEKGALNYMKQLTTETNSIAERLGQDNYY